MILQRYTTVFFLNRRETSKHHWKPLKAKLSRSLCWEKLSVPEGNQRWVLLSAEARKHNRLQGVKVLLKAGMSHSHLKSTGFPLHFTASSWLWRAVLIVCLGSTFFFRFSDPFYLPIWEGLYKESAEAVKLLCSSLYVMLFSEVSGSGKRERRQHSFWRAAKQIQVKKLKYTLGTVWAELGAGICKICCSSESCGD